MANSQRSAPEPAAPNYLGGRSDSLQDRYMWVWNGTHLRVQKGTAHAKNLAWANEDVEQFYRGWFDPATHELFLVSPAPPPGRPPTRLRRLPDILDRLLHRRFGDDLVYRVF
ncbi:MAG: hypothetical protein IT443_07620 [Phycisphaeraceae bacterium]|nr:hypothetical protein [Phycisphaeraceae bacterium]